MYCACAEGYSSAFLNYLFCNFSINNEITESVFLLISSQRSDGGMGVVLVTVDANLRAAVVAGPAKLQTCFGAEKLQNKYTPPFLDGLKQVCRYVSLSINIGTVLNVCNS